MLVSSAVSGLTREDVQRALDSDRRALTQLVRALMPVIRVEVGVALLRRARPKGRDPRQDVEDFSQSVLLHLLAQDGKLLRQWDPQRGRSLASFVRLITRQRVSRTLQGHKGMSRQSSRTSRSSLPSPTARTESSSPATSSGSSWSASARG